MVSIPVVAVEGLTVALLRELFRNYLAFRSTYEAYGVDEVAFPGGGGVTIWDMDYLVHDCLGLLDRRKSEAIRLFLIANMREVDAAEAMGLRPVRRAKGQGLRPTPIGQYATDGIEDLMAMIERGDLPRFGGS
jgi:hypothetical protein